MRRFKEVLIIFSLVFVILIDNVWAGGTYTDISFYSDTFTYSPYNYSNYGTIVVKNYIYSAWNVLLNVTVFKLNGVDFSNAVIKDYGTYVGIGNQGGKYYIEIFQIKYDNRILNDVRNYIGKTIEIKANFEGVPFQGPDAATFYFQGSFYLKGVLNSDGTISVISLSDKPSLTLVYNNDYNYTSNTASFTLQYSNFSFNYFTFLNTDTPQGSTIYGYHLLNYNLTQSGSTYIVHCSFDNTFVNLSNPHYLFWVVHGLDANGNPIDLSGSTSFDLNAPNVPQVPKGVLVITSPKTGDNFASGTTQIPVSVVYGGDVTDVTDPNYNHTSVTVGATHALHNAGYVNLTSYSIINGTTVWSGTLNLNPGEGDGEYTLLASLDRTTLMSDTVTITIGGTTGNPILDFLKAVWAEFKDWFVKTMKVLFVPNATDFSSQIAQGWVQVSNPLPGVTPQYTIDIPMSTTLGTQNGVATIDFKTPITSWSGYSTMQSVIRLGLYTLLVFLIWSMVT